MPSSTSSSEDAADVPSALRDRRVPDGPWRGPLLAGLALALLLGAAAELGWRALGHRPSVDAEDLDLWAAERARASNGDDNVLVVIGKSRALLDLHLPTLRARYPSARVVQLALPGKSAAATFRDLARDEDFRGRVLFGLTEPDVVGGFSTAQQDAVGRARALSPDAWVNARVRAVVSRAVVLRSAELVPQRVLAEAWGGRVPRPSYLDVSADRGAVADFSRTDVVEARRQVERVQQRSLERMRGREVHPSPWLADLLRLAKDVAALQARGGDVAFVHLPVSGASERFSERFYPRRHFWDHIASTLGVRTVHYRDVPSLRAFELPDTSHLDAKDAPRFTEALVDELVRTGFLPAR